MTKVQGQMKLVLVDELELAENTQQLVLEGGKIPELHLVKKLEAGDPGQKGNQNQAWRKDDQGRTSQEGRARVLEKQGAEQQMRLSPW